MSCSIILCGARGCGKSTVQHMLAQYHGYKTTALAGTLKDAVSAIFGYPRDVLDGVTEEHRKIRTYVDPYWSKVLKIPNFSMVYALKHIGTDLFRNTFHPDVWIHSLCRNVTDIRTAPYVVSDVRYANEHSTFKQMGFKCILITRPGTEDLDPHASEQYYKTVKPDIVIVNDGSIESLQERVCDVVSTISK